MTNIKRVSNFCTEFIPGNLQLQLQLMG